MTSITYYPIIGAFLATLCVHDILPFIFRFMFHACSIWNFIYLYSMIPMYSTSFMYSYSFMNLLYLEIGIIPIESSKLKLWHFHAKLVSLKYSFSGVLTPYMTLVLYIHLGAKGSSPIGITQIRVPKLKICLKQPGLLYVQNRTRNWLKHSPTFE